jgi:hypothetical protein
MVTLSRIKSSLEEIKNKKKDKIAQPCRLCLRIAYNSTREFTFTKEK